MDLSTTTLKIKCVLVLLLTAASAFLASLWPIKLGEIFDLMSNGVVYSLSQPTIYTVVTAGIIFLLSNVAPVLSRVAIDRIVSRFERDLKNVGLEQLLSLPISKIAGEGMSAEITSKINMAVGGFSQLFRLIIGDFIPAVFVGTFLITQAFLQAPPIIAVIMLSYIIFAFLVSWRQIKSQKGIREQILFHKARYNGCVCQAIQSVEEIRLMATEDYECKLAETKTEDIRRIEVTHHTAMGRYDAIKQTIKTLFFIGLIGTCLFLISQTGSITGGIAIASLLLFNGITAPVDMIYRFLDEISSSAVKTKALAAIMRLPRDPVFDIVSSGKSFNGQEGVMVNNFSVFAPDESGTVLTHTGGLILPTQSQSVTGIKGPSGSGKSSLFKGIGRLYPYLGSVSICGVDVGEISQQDLAKTIFCISQKPKFVAGSIRENLSYGLKSDDISDEALINALKNACLFDDLMEKSSTPLDIQVSEGAKNFSEGQQRRLALARVFLRRPRLFVLDEATSNIDSFTQERILENLELYAADINAGIVYISHDSAVLKRCTTTFDIEAKAENIRFSA